MTQPLTTPTLGIMPNTFLSEAPVTSAYSEKFLLVFLSSYPQFFSLAGVPDLVEALKTVSTVATDDERMTELQRLTGISEEDMQDVFKKASRI